jgi:hypothetical protein
MSLLFDAAEIARPPVDHKTAAMPCLQRNQTSFFLDEFIGFRSKCILC